MKPKFQPDLESAEEAALSPSAPGFESYDASEERFAASLDGQGPVQTPKFIPEIEGEVPAMALAEGGLAAQPAEEDFAPLPSLPEEPPAATQENAMAWKQEVSSRVSQYRARRRPKPPRYPSLALKFDPPQTEWRGEVAASSPVIPASRQALAMESIPVVEEAAPLEEPVAMPREEVRETPRPLPSLRSALAEGESAKVIEFPRFGVAPPARLDELAEPVLDRPRILEVPEIELPPPALGGILIETVEESPEEKRPGFEVPLQSARMSRRFLAAIADGAILLAAMALFTYLVFQIIHVIPPLAPSLAFGGLVTGIFWAGYHYLFLVHGGTTPGLWLAKLRLSRFDGEPVSRSLRRWRALASILSGIALGLGYAWCFLDEDQLCWHDRATHTYLAPVAPEPAE
ncbi:MAG: RDD family protein [Acidobacteria bacterium]|nr:RDD family protein [Acidobacteriota bacterium]